MSVYLFTKLFNLFLLLLMSDALLCGHTLVNGETSSVFVNTVELFKKGETISNASKSYGEEKADSIVVKNYYSPVFLLTRKYFFAFAGVNRNNAANEYFDIITKHVEKNTLLSKEDVSKNIKWETQFAVQHYMGSIKDESSVKGLLAVANENKIYFLIMNCSTKTGDPVSSNNYYFEFELVVGAVNDEPAKKNVWTKNDKFTAVSLAERLSKEFKDKPVSFSLGGSAFFN